MKKARILACAIASAFLLALGLPNEVFLYGCPPLGFLALVPLYLAMLEAPTYGFAALAAGLYGAVHHGLSSYWLYFFHGFAFWTLGSTIIAYAVIYAVYGMYLSFFLRKAGPYRPLVFALFWTVLEYAKSVGFLGYPWGLLPFTQTDALVFLQIADMTGVYGVSFFLALANGALAELLGIPRRGGSLALHRPRAFTRAEAYRMTAAAALAIAVVAAYGAWKLLLPPKPSASIKAALVQQNVDPWEADEAAGIKKNMDLARMAVAEAGLKPDLVLFSESSLSRPFAESARWYERNPAGDPFLPFVRELGTWLFTGSPIVLDWEKGEATNSVILISPEGKQVEDYAKIHPVPFAESIPFWEWKPFREFIQNVVGLESGWVMGTRYTIFNLDTQGSRIRFGAPICFEDAFPEVCRRFFLEGADLLVNLTNDSWSKTESSETQHFAVARIRAIESRRSLLRSTNGGLSCVVDARGAVIDSLPLFKADARVVTVPIYRPSAETFYIRYGDWFAFLCIFIFAALFFILFLSGTSERRRRP